MKMIEGNGIGTQVYKLIPQVSQSVDVVVPFCPGGKQCCREKLGFLFVD